MKPIKDIFNTHIEGLYKGYEVDAPTSVQEGVFHQLDALKASTASGITSGGFISKAVLGAAVVIVGFAWYLMPASEDNVVVDEVEIEAVEEIVVDEIMVVETLDELEVTPEILEDKLKVEVNVEEQIVADIHETVVASEVEKVKQEVKVVKVNETDADDKIIEEEVPTEEVSKVKEPQEPEEVLEWVLPAKLEVDE
jgi:hypothetical protein